jgi:polyphosphate kinase 2 (PPK2 family)
LQDRLFAEGKRALLVVLQGIDCSGKDGTVRAVFNTSGPLGVTVKSFGVPSEVERAHDTVAGLILPGEGIYRRVQSFPL